MKKLLVLPTLPSKMKTIHIYKWIYCVHHKHYERGQSTTKSHAWNRTQATNAFNVRQNRDKNWHFGAKRKRKKDLESDLIGFLRFSFGFIAFYNLTFFSLWLTLQLHLPLLWNDGVHCVCIRLKLFRLYFPFSITEFNSRSNNMICRDMGTWLLFTFVIIHFNLFIFEIEFVPD